MKKWFVPPEWTATTAIDLRVGGTYSHDMLSNGESSNCSSDKSATPGTPTHYMHTGEYLEIHRPEKLVFTWNSPSVQNSQVTVEFKKLGDCTEVTITHELLPTDALRKGHSEGWTEHLGTLSTLLG